jgi:hypothetical protein
MKKKNAIMLYMLFLVSVVVRAQSVGEVDEKLVKYVKNVSAAEWSIADNRDDMIAIANNELKNYLKEVNGEVLLTGQFPKSEEYGLQYVASEDGNVRIYCWNIWDGGGRINQSGNIVVYKGKNGIKISDIIDSDSDGDSNWQQYIKTVHTRDNDVIYLVTNFVAHSLTSRTEGIHAYTIKEDAFVARTAFKTKTRYLNSIEFDYELGRNNLTQGITLSNDKSFLSVPIVRKDGTFTDNKLIYRFDGEMFVFKGKE